MPLSVRVEKRLTESKTAKVTVPIGSLFGALLIGSVLLLLVGANPWDTYIAMFSGALGGRYALSETLVKATPIILTALAVSIAFRMQFWNIGAEGQLALGGFAAAGVALFVPTRYPELPIWAIFILACIAAVLGGALWALVPALLKAYVNVNEIITTLMLNYVAILWIEYLFYGPWKDPQGYGFPGSAQFVREIWLGRIGPAWVTPAVILLTAGLMAGVGLSALFAQVRRQRIWLGLGTGAVAMVVGWLAAPHVSRYAIELTALVTRGWLLPEGPPQAATAALLLVTLVLILALRILSGVSRDPRRRDAAGTACMAGALFCGGVVMGQIVMLIHLLSGTRLHTGFLFGLLGAAFIWLVLERTKWGYEIRVIGENPRAAAYAGISLARNIILVAMLSGALAGLAGMSEVLGVSHRLQKGLTVGYGYTAILVAWLASLSPWGILVWGIVWAALLVGGDQIQITMRLPAATALSLQGLIGFCVLAGQFWISHRIRVVWSGWKRSPSRAGEVEA